MECACFSAGCDDFSTVLFDKIVKARRVHRCGECGCEIQPGQKYRKEKEIFDGHLSEHKTCLDCSSVRDNLCCEFYWGQIWDLVYDNLLDEDSIPWAKIGSLTPGARNKICEIIEKMWEDWEDDENEI